MRAHTGIMMKHVACHSAELVQMGLARKTKTCRLGTAAIQMPTQQKTSCAQEPSHIEPILLGSTSLPAGAFDLMPVELQNAGLWNQSPVTRHSLNLCSSYDHHVT